MSTVSVPQPGRTGNQTVAAVVMLDPTTGLPAAPGSGSGAGSGSGSVTVTNFPGTQPVSVTTLPLPSGAATATGVAAVATNVGPATARAPVTNPALAADTNQLLRGILKVLNDQTALLQTIVENTTPAAPETP